MRSHIALVVTIALVALGCYLILAACDASPRPVCYSSVHTKQSARQCCGAPSLAHRVSEGGA